MNRLLVCPPLCRVESCTPTPLITSSLSSATSRLRRYSTHSRRHTEIARDTRNGEVEHARSAECVDSIAIGVGVADDIDGDGDGDDKEGKDNEAVYS